MPLDFLSKFIFGCFPFVHVHDQNHSKLDPRSLKCVFLGYSTTQKGYRRYSLDKRIYFVSSNDTFENQTSFSKGIHKKVKIFVLLFLAQTLMTSRLSPQIQFS